MLLSKSNINIEQNKYNTQNIKKNFQSNLIFKIVIKLINDSKKKIFAMFSLDSQLKRLIVNKIKQKIIFFKLFFSKYKKDKNITKLVTDVVIWFPIKIDLKTVKELPLLSNVAFL